MPSSPSATASTSGESGTMVTTTSASRTASARLPAPRPPWSTSRWTGSGLRLWPMTSKPAVTRLAAIGPPMMPRPMKATVVMRDPPCRGGGRSDGGTAQPAEAVGGRAAGHVLQPDPAVVTGVREPAEVPVEVELPGARFVPAGRVGDLHVRDPRAVRGDHPVEVLTVDGQVVQVAQEPQVGHPGLLGDAVD